MKKLLITIMLIAFSFGLSSCLQEMTYDDLLLAYQQDVEARQSIYESYIKMYDELSNGVVKSIVKVTKITSNQQTAIGSGFVFYEDQTSYYVLTNHHVVETTDNAIANISVTDYLGKNKTATVLALDAKYDLAVLSISKIGSDLDPITFTDETLRFKDKVIVIGYPDGQINGITIGEFVDYDEIDISSSTHFIEVDFSVLIIDAPVEAGSSGSVVLNDQYEVVGIVYAGNFFTGESVSEYAFSIPKDKIIEFFNLYDIAYENEVTS